MYLMVRGLVMDDTPR